MKNIVFRWNEHSKNTPPPTQTFKMPLLCHPYHIALYLLQLQLPRMASSCGIFFVNGSVFYQDQSYLVSLAKLSTITSPLNLFISRKV